MTPDRALIYSILNNGLAAFNETKRRNIKSEDLFGEDIKIFKLFEEYIPKGRLPSLEEIYVFSGVTLKADPVILDAANCAEAIYKRKLSTTLNEGVGKVTDLIVKDPVKARDELQDLLHATIRTHGKVKDSNSIDAIEEVENRYLLAESSTDGILGLSSPWQSMDKTNLGLQGGELHIVFARKKTGKTFISFAWFEHIWKNLKDEENILIVSMEMPPWQVNQRMFAIRNRLDYGLFKSGKLPPADRKRFFDWCKEQKDPDSKKSKLIVVGSDVVREVSDIVAIASQFRPKAILVDGFYILGKNSKKQKHERVTENAESLKLDLAIPLNIPVMATTQLNGTVSNQDLDADTDAASFAKGLADYADASYGLFMDDMMKQQGKRILSVMEARDFVSIRMQINMNLTTMDFSEIKVIDDENSFHDTGVKLGELPDFEENEQLIF